MAYTTITAETIGLADGDTSPQPLDGTVRITPRFPSATVPGGFLSSGPIIVDVSGGSMPQTVVPSKSDATALVEFHLYDRFSGPAKLPSTEIPLEPDTTISLSDYLPVAVDESTGMALARGDRGYGITSVSGQNGDILITWDGGENGETLIPMPDAIEGPKGDTGPRGLQGEQGPQGYKGDVGSSAYQIAVAGGFTGTEAEWLASLQGQDGVDGRDGADGEPGPTGPKGDRGDQGLQGFKGDRGEKGDQGETGPRGIQGPKGDAGDVVFEGIDPGITVRDDDVVIGNATVLAENHPSTVDPGFAPHLHDVAAPEWAWAVTDSTDQVALGVRADGSVAGADSINSLPYDVILLVGQSNMQGRGAQFLDRDEWPGIDQFPAANKPDAGRIVPAVDPLQHPGTIIEATPASLAIPFAREYRRKHPGRRVLLVPAAYGATAFSSTTGAHWDWTVTTGTPLAPLAVQQAKDALAAAGPSARFAGILWHQGEGDLSISDQYADKLDGLIDYLRSELNAPEVPVVVGQMSMDRGYSASREEVDAAHQQTPARVVRSAFAPSPRGLHNPGDATHFSTRALDIIGRNFYQGLMRAAYNVPGARPMGPENVQAKRVGSTTVVTWDPAWSRVTDYRIEWRPESGEWGSSVTSHPLSVGTTAVITSSEATEVRVTAINDDGDSPPVVAQVSGSTETIQADLSSIVHTDQGWNPEYGPTVTVSRFGPVVELVVEGLHRAEGAATGNFTVVQIPWGYRPAVAKYPQTWRDAMAYIGTNGQVRITNPGGPLDYFSTTFFTTNPMPA